MEVLHYVHLRARDVVILLAFTLLGSVTELGLPTMLANMIDSGVARSDRALVIGIAVGMGVLVVAGLAAGFVSATLAARVSTHMAADLRGQLFHKVARFSPEDMDKFGTASLVTRSTSDVNNVQMFVSLLLQIGVMAPLMLVAGIVLSSATGGKLATVLFVSVPVLFIVAAFIMRVVNRLSKRLRSKLDDINRIFLETLEGVRPIRAFNREEYEKERFGRENAEFTDINVAMGRLMAALFPLVGLLFGFTTTGVMWRGAAFASEGQLDVGALVANVQYISMILISLMMVSAVVMFYPSFAACGSRISEVLGWEPRIRDAEGKPVQRTSRGKVEFQHVSFIYDGAEEPVVRDLSFSVEPGTVTAIIGPTGCGKSSVLSLIPRLFESSLGNVVVDGVNVKKYPLHELRDLMGYVPQKNVLFKGDIASNLSWGDEEADEEAMWHALDIACASDFVREKEGGLHAEVAQGGTNFSGGQRQRLAIARALMRPAELYLFDDSFSALDMKTDRRLRENIQRELGDATLIIVAQRVGTIINADQIIVLDDGICQGRGTHEELLETCDMYREMAMLQLGEQQVADTMRARARRLEQERAALEASALAELAEEGGER